MVRLALGDLSSGTDLPLADGRPLHMVKLVGAVRQHKERSTNVFIDVKDGTGLIQVKVWVNKGDKCSMVLPLRQDALTNHAYVHVIGQVCKFDGQRQIVANNVRPVSSGNKLTYHLLEVMHLYKRHVTMRSDAQATDMMGMGMGIGIGKMALVLAPPGGAGGGGTGIGMGG
jgi:aspartyl/asparaginyl-tRNA synthetase